MTDVPELFKMFWSKIDGAKFRSSWDYGEWLAYFNERAAIAEYDGEMPRASAEGSAFDQCIEKWRNQKRRASLSNLRSGVEY